MTPSTAQGVLESGSELLGTAATARSAAQLRRAEDARLMRRVQEGDERAFADLVERYKDPLVNYLCKLTRCRDRAEELAQEAFVKVFRAADRYREQGYFSAFLFRVATNHLRSEERRAKRWRVLAPLFGSSQETQQRSPQGTTLSREATGAVADALRCLPLHYRSPLVLREIEGWSYREIADSLGLREGTVKSRINRAKALLKKELLPYWEGQKGTPS